MKGKDYIFAGVPPEVWNGFKSAPSLGHYYNQVIRGRYHFDLEGKREAMSRALRLDPLPRWLRASVVLIATLVVISCGRSPERRAANADSHVEDEKSRWVPIEDEDTVEVSYDRQSVVRLDSTTYRVWVKSIYRTPHQSGEGPYTRLLIHADYDCALRRTRALQASWYDSLDVKVGGLKTMKDEWSDCIPDSRGEHIMERVCKDFGKVRQ